MPKQLLIDGHSLLFRAYHALPPLTRRDGTPTGALYGFAAMFLKVVDEESADRVIVVFDAPDPTFRHVQYEQYKGNREAAPDDFRVQVPMVEALLDRMGVPRLAVPGYEADDVLGSLARMGTERGYETAVVTGDRDLLQLVDDRVSVLLTTRGGISELERMDAAATEAKMGVKPSQVPDLKGLMGDASDNIRGVAGIGEKSAKSLVQQYGSITAIYDRLDAIDNPRWVKALRTGREDAFTSRDLATIDRSVPIEWPTVNEPFRVVLTEELAAFLEEMELGSIRRRLERMVGGGGSGATARPDRAPVPSAGTLPGLDEAVVEVDASAFHWEDGDVVTVLAVDADRFHVLNGRGESTAVSELPAGRYQGFGVKAIARKLLARGGRVDWVEDGSIQAYLLDSEVGRYELDAVAARLGVEGGGEAGWRLRIARAVIAEQSRRLEAEGLTRVYREVEMPLIPVLARMEHVGVRVDRKALEALGEEIAGEIRRLEREIHELAGEPFNIQSTQQLAAILFDKLNLPRGKKTKTGYSTDADTLEALAGLHPVVEKVLQYRQLTKIQGTYIDGLAPLIGSDGRIHTTFHQTVAATGRLSSSDPNLQNIPVREAVGRRVRGVFVPSPGRELLGADYSQIELRILAHLSEDEHLIQAFWEGEDIHRRTAAEMFNLPVDAVDATSRNRAKAINFGIVYGISDFGLARDTGVSRAEAGEYIARYFARYPRLRAFFDAVLESARDQGWVATILGRRRPLADIRAKNAVRRRYAERMAINTVVQGSAADLIKLAMVAIDGEARRIGWNSDLVLQVHDELIWDALPEEEEAIRAVARERMTGVLPLRVPLVVDFKRGATWETMAPFAPREERS